MLVFLEPEGLTKKGKEKWESMFPYLPMHKKHGLQMSGTDELHYYMKTMTRQDFKDYWSHEEFLKNVASWNFATKMFRGISSNQIETLLIDDDYEKSGMELFMGNLFESLRYIEDRLERLDDELYDVKNKLPEDK